MRRSAGIGLAGLLPFVLAPGTHPVAPPRAAPNGAVVRLAEFLPPAAPTDAADSAVVAFEADLSKAKAVRGVRAFEATTTAVSADLDPGEPTIEFPFACEADGIDAISLTMSASAGKARPRLFFLREGEPDPAGDAAVSFPWRFDRETRTVTVPLRGLLSWQGRIRALRLVPTNVAAAARVTGLRGLRLAPPPTRRERVTIGAESRDAIVTASPSPIEFEIVPEPGARLDFGIGVPPDAWNRVGGPVTFDVTVNGRERFRRALDPRVNWPDRQWVDASIDLSKFAGRATRIRFGIAFTANESCPRAAIGAPVVTAPSRRARDGRGSPGAGVRHVILLSLDTLRADHLSSYGYGPPTSPCIDTLASAGVRFETAMANSPETLMSHATLFTSLLPSAHGHAKSTQRLSPRIPTLAAALRDEGFLTAAFVGNGFLSSLFGYENGFDRYDDGVPRADFLKFDTARSFERAIDFLDRNRDRDTFTFLHTYEIHTAYAPPRDALAPFADAAYAGPVGDVFRFWPDAVKLFGTGTPAPNDVKRVVALYDAEIRYTDSLVGRLLDALRERSLDGATLVVLLSDHGEEFMEHGTLANHGHSLQEEMLRIPLLLRGPNLPAGRVVRGVVSHIDVAPTILDYLGVARPETFRGESLLEAIRAGERRGGVAISEDLTTFRRASVRRDGTRYVRTRNIERERISKLLALHPEIRPGVEPVYLRLVREEYYDLAADPAGRTNAASRNAAACAAEAAFLGSALDEARRFRRASGGPEPAAISGALVQQLHQIGYFGASGFDGELDVDEEIREESIEEPEDVSPPR